MFKVAGVNREPGRWLRVTSGFWGIIARQSGVGTVTPEPEPGN